MRQPLMRTVQVLLWFIFWSGPAMVSAGQEEQRLACSVAHPNLFNDLIERRPDGLLAGPLVDEMVKIFDRAGIELVPPTHHIWKRALTEFDRGDVDLLMGVMITGDMDENAIFSRPVVSIPLRLYRKTRRIGASR